MTLEEPSIQQNLEEIFMMNSDKTYSYSEYLKKYTSDHRAREYWKLLKIRGRNDNRHIQFNLCQKCIPALYANKNRMMCNVSKDGKLENVNINVPLCESCIERNLFEVNTYVYKCSLKRPPVAIDINEKLHLDNEDIHGEVKKQKKTKECIEEPSIMEHINEEQKKKPRKTKKNKTEDSDIVVIDK